MSSTGIWTISLALAYTAFLIVAGLIAKRRKSAGQDFFVAGRRFHPFVVALCITGLFSGSSFIAIVELSYHTGISAIWYGVAETVQILLIAFLLVMPFRRRMVITISGLIGDRFGRLAMGVAGSITAFTFPMWSAATAIAFASALHACTGWSIEAAIICTALLLLFYLWAGGMWSIAFTQAANCVIFAFMLILGLVAVFINPGLEGLRQLAIAQPQMLDWTAVGLPLVLAWFGTFIVNVILAQAALQMALSCRTPEAGRLGLLSAAGLGVPFIVLGSIFGMAAAIVVPGQQLGLVALPQYMADVLPAPLAAVFLLGIWACALGWGGPCQLSGATSLGRDVVRAIWPRASDADLVRCTRWSLVLLTVLMIVFGLLRTEQSAWWNILAWTPRNGATLAPVLAALLWPLATRRAAIGAMLLGFASGLLWYMLSGWSIQNFFAGIHPVWIGMSVNLTALVLINLLQSRGRVAHPEMGEPGLRHGLLLLLAALTIAGVSGYHWSSLHAHGLGGLLIFSVVVLISLAVFQLTQARAHAPSMALGAGSLQV